MQTAIPIDLAMAKVNVFADTPYNIDQWVRVYRMDGLLVVARVSQKEYLSKKLQIRIESGEKLDEKQIDAVVDRVRYEIGADEKLQPLKRASEKDLHIRLAIQDKPGMRLYANSNTVEAAICVILAQKHDFYNYIKALGKLVRKYGEQVPWDAQLHAFPAIEQLASMKATDWKSLGLGFRADQLGELTEKDYEMMHVYAYYPIYDRGVDGLVKIPGIGEHTARYIMTYAARRYNRVFYDRNIQDLLEDKYKIRSAFTLSDFDKWALKQWGEEPALALHALVQNAMSAYQSDMDYWKIHASE